MTCARPGCGRPLTARQIREGTRHCSRACAGQVRRLRPLTRPGRTTCRVCEKALTRIQVGRGNEHCSMRCFVVTRHGVQPPRRTTCAHVLCGGPLTTRQRWRRRDFCSKSCAKAAQWREKPGVWQRITANSKAVQRRNYVERLKAFLKTATPSQAAARGFWTGYRVGAERMRREGRTRTARRANPADRAALLARLVAAATTKGDAYRSGYRAGFDAALAASAPVQQAA